MASALRDMLAEGRFDTCCLPRYLALAPQHGHVETQIPVASERDVDVRVIVWPVGEHERRHPHTDGWTVFVPVRGRLEALEDAPDDKSGRRALPVRVPVTLRPEDAIRHRVANVGSEPALSVHVSGKA